MTDNSQAEATAQETQNEPTTQQPQQPTQQPQQPTPIKKLHFKRMEKLE